MKKLTFLTAILIATTTFAQIPSYVPSNGLLGWWPFNGNANDESGNGNNGTVNGATLTADRNGVANSAYSFDGIDDFIQLQTPSLNNAITISFWAYDLGGYPNTYSINPRYVSSELCNGGFSLINNVSNLPNGLFFTRSRGSSTADIFSSIIPTILVNQYIVFTYDGTIGKFYINGHLVSSVNHSGTITTSTNLFFGKSGCNNAGQMIDAFKGNLDDIGIWNRALTDCEIKNLYNSGIPSSSQTQTAVDSYTWPVNNLTYTQSGIYTDTLVNAAGCDSIITLNLTLSFTGINELNTSSLSISPNPTAGDFTIAGLELYNNISSMRVSDVNGKLVKELDPTATKFSLGTVKSGVYFLTITAGDKQEVIKIMKE